MMSLGEQIDALYELRERRIALQREADDLKRQETNLEFELMSQVTSLGIAAAKGRRASFSVTHEVVPNVNDWSKLHDYIIIEKDFTLLQKRIGVTAWRDYYETGLLIPGTDAVTLNKVNLRKV